MKTAISKLITILICLLITALCLAALGRILPVNSRPCFGTAKDGHLRWHAYSECAH